jgi:Planctomycete cytochrome C
MRTLALLTLLAASSAFAATDADREKAFKADIAPILEKSCGNCHDPKKAKNGKVKSGFDITSLATIVAGGKENGAGITWGNTSKSTLFTSSELGLNNATEDAAMPPKKSQEKNPALTKEQVAKVKAFIEAK